MKRFHMALIGVLLSSTGTAQLSSGVSSTASALGAPKLLGGGVIVDKAKSPALSLNGIFLGAGGTAVTNKGLMLQELEGKFSAAVDSYFFSNVVLNSTGAGNLSVEEAYATTLSLPVVLLKAGKFLVNFGENNLVHTHGQPLIDRPLVNERLLGARGLNSVGIEASAILPWGWDSEVTLGAIRAEGTTPFTTTNAESIAGLAHWENSFPLTAESALSLGGSYAGGGNNGGKATHLAGVDVKLQFPTSGTRENFGLAWVSEVIHRWENTATASEKALGIYSTLLARLDAKWWVGGRFDHLKAANNDVTTAENLMFAYVFSESSALRAQGGLLQNPGTTKTAWQALLQYNLTIGSHSGHAY